MKQVYFLVADSVHRFAEGKIVVVGIFDVINAKAVPILFRPFGVAIRLEAGKTQEGRTYKGVLTLSKFRSAKPMFSASWTITFGKRDRGAPASAVLAMTVPFVQFESFGTYVFEVKTGRRCVASTKLYVREVEEAVPSGGGE